MRILILAVVVLVVLPAWASEPGEPLDCTDIVIDVPGFSCVTFAPFNLAYEDPYFGKGSNLVFDNEGRLLVGKVTATDLEIWRFDGASEERIVHFPLWRGSDWIRFRLPGDTWYDTVIREGMTFDSMNGRLLVPLASGCEGSDCPCGSNCYGAGYGGRWIAAIEGFTTTFEIMQSYLPTANALGFRVPYMPEGMNGADSFDTYYGNLATVGDWSQAQGLQCDYPAEIPSTGDYLTVADTLPTPSAGSGYYYVTAVSHQGATRYGRKNIGGVTSGRDPAALPGCGE